MKYKGQEVAVDGRLSHPARGAWIEMPMLVTRAEADVSHPARGAWIEIAFGGSVFVLSFVAPRKGCVD